MGKTIRLYDLTPEVYYRKSRDFQYIGRLYDLVLNSIKLNTDLINGLPVNAKTDPGIIDLLSLTLGFKSKHNYNVKQLAALCSSFTKILRAKGTKTGIKMACDTLLYSEGITEESEVEFKDNVVVIYIPATLSDINLLKDILIYILPAGLGCKIIRENRIYTQPTTNVAFENSADMYFDKEGDLSIIVKPNEAEEIFEERAKNTAGLYVNTTVIRPNKYEIEEDTNETETN